MNYSATTRNNGTIRYHRNLILDVILAAVPPSRLPFSISLSILRDLLSSHYNIPSCLQRLSLDALLPCRHVIGISMNLDALRVPRCSHPLTSSVILVIPSEIYLNYMTLPRGQLTQHSLAPALGLRSQNRNRNLI